jgi:phosphatidylserine decarboxylase
LDLAEVERPLADYPSFDAFFTRKLREGVRTVDPGADTVISPVDGAVSEFGVATSGRLIQAKGIDYTLRGLLIDADEAACFSGGSYVTLYLAPKDYHRIHSPSEGVITGWRHIPGAVFPVNPPSVRNVAGLFAHNERLITYLRTPLGRMAVVKVAATGVSDITAAYDASIRTRRTRHTRRVDYAEPKPVGKGEELGAFHLGSTVIVLFENGRVQLESLVHDQRVLFGQTIARRSMVSAGDRAA